jgi:predicted metal-dependent phosphoesterase TrpH
MKNLLLSLTSFLFLPSSLISQVTHVHSRMIDFPDVPGYYTMICDFHQHTVFSDGSVWPSIRVQEALRDSLDAISITDHIEHQPKSADIPHPDRNRSYILAKEQAKAHPLIVINGVEITRSMPPGHCNAIFIEDANALNIPDVEDVFAAAQQQNAFVFWNHPDWVSQRKDGIARIDKLHEKLIQQNQLQGIEIVNEFTYSEEALQIGLDYDLTLMGTSDIHGLIDWDYRVPEGGHRPVTLVFSKDKTAEGVKEGLLARRTVVWYKNNLIGREKDVLPLIQSCLFLAKAEYWGVESVAHLQIRNDSDVDFILANRSPYTFQSESDVFVIPQHSTFKLSVKTLSQLDSFTLTFEVLNATIAPGKHPTMEMMVKM